MFQPPQLSLGGKPAQFGAIPPQPQLPSPGMQQQQMLNQATGAPQPQVGRGPTGSQAGQGFVRPPAAPVHGVRDSVQSTTADPEKEELKRRIAELEAKYAQLLKNPTMQQAATQPTQPTQQSQGYVRTMGFGPSGPDPRSRGPQVNVNQGAYSSGAVRSQARENNARRAKGESVPRMSSPTMTTQQRMPEAEVQQRAQAFKDKELHSWLMSSPGVLGDAYRNAVQQRSEPLQDLVSSGYSIEGTVRRQKKRDQDAASR